MSKFNGGTFTSAFYQMYVPAMFWKFCLKNEFFDLLADYTVGIGISIARDFQYLCQGSTDNTFMRKNLCQK